jgi:hypothetical protein
VRPLHAARAARMSSENPKPQPTASGPAANPAANLSPAALAAASASPVLGPLLRSRSAPRIPGYEIEGEIGRGATGVVWRARQVAVDREVALKVLHADLVAKPRTIQRLQREARTTARLAHPHIVTAIDMGETGGQWWFAMELVDGPSLALRLRQQGRLSEREALRLFIPLCEALVHMHEHGVVHRDIKPGNILIDRRGGARLADLGLAFADDDPSLTRSGTTLGTPHYISPEQARDPGAADIRSDIWSFGATLFHALCGRPPFAGESLAEVLSSVLYAAIPDPQALEPDLSRGISLVLRKCLVRDPAGRYPGPRELLLDLERVRERRAPKVRASSLDPVQGRLPRWAVGLLAAGALVLLGLGGWWWQIREDERLASARYEPLEALVDALAADGSPQLAAALGRIDSLEGELPPEQRARWRSLRSALRESLAAEVSRIRGTVDARLAHALEGGDFAQAREIVERDLSRLLASHTGFTVERLPPEHRAWVEGVRRGLDDAQALVQNSAEQQLSQHIELVLVPNALELLAAQRWQSARNALRLPLPSLLEQLESPARKLPSTALSPIADRLAQRIEGPLEAIEDDWRRADGELATWVAQRTLELDAQLQAGALVGGAAELLAAWHRELAARGIASSEQLLDRSAVALAELERGRLALEQREQALQLAQRGESDELLGVLERWLAQALPADAWLRRDYGAIEALWRSCEADLRELSADVRTPWRESVNELVRLRKREAELLASLLARARAALIASGTRELRVGNIRVLGRVEASGEASAPTLRFTTGPEQPDYQIHFSTPEGGLPGPATPGALPAGAQPRAAELVLSVALDRAQLEELAGLAGPPADLPPADRLLLALFRAREGDPSGSRAALEAGPLPANEEALAADLGARVERREEERALHASLRSEEAAALLARLTPERVEADPSGALQTVGVLLDDYMDVESVRAAQLDLRRQRAELKQRVLGQAGPPSLDELRDAFAVEQASLPARGRAQLVFDLEAGQAGAFEQGSWSSDGGGWRAPHAATDWPDLLRQAGPRLVLRSPLEPQGGTLEVELELEQLSESGPPRFFGVSCAGYHVALLGPDLPGSGRPRVIAGSDSFEGLIARARDGQGREHAQLLRAGSAHRLRIEIQPRLGRVRVDLDGETVLRSTLPAPRDRAGERVLALQSWEPVRVTRIELGSATR